MGWIICSVVAVLVACGACAHARQYPDLSLGSGAPSKAPYLDFGSPLPELGVDAWVQPPPDDKTFQVAMKGKAAVVIVRWRTFGGSDDRLIPRLNALAEELKNEPIVFAVIADDNPKNVESFVKTTSVRALVGVDTDGSSGRWFRYSTTTILVDPAGRIQSITLPRYVNAGVLRDLIAGKPLSLPSSYEGSPSKEKSEGAIPDPSQDFVDIRRVLTSRSESEFAAREGRWSLSGYQPIELMLDAWWGLPHVEPPTPPAQRPGRTVGTFQTQDGEIPTVELSIEGDEQLGPYFRPTRDTDIGIEIFHDYDFYRMRFMQYALEPRMVWYERWRESASSLKNGHRVRVQNSANLGDANVSAIVNLPGANEASMRDRLKEAIRGYFDVDVTLVHKNRPALVLRRPLVLKPGYVPRGSIRPAKFPGRPYDTLLIYGAPWCSNTRMSDFADLLEVYVFERQYRVIDETNDANEYDLRLDMKLPRDVSVAQVAKCVAQQLGLVLEWAERPQPLLIIRKRADGAAAQAVPKSEHVAGSR